MFCNETVKLRGLICCFKTEVQNFSENVRATPKL